jgi:hypothetical protein
LKIDRSLLAVMIAVVNRSQATVMIFDLLYGCPRLQPQDPIMGGMRRQTKLLDQEADGLSELIGRDTRFASRFLK